MAREAEARPWVHIAIGVAVRELDAKTLLAAVLLKHGFNVSIVGLKQVWNDALLLPRGTYIDTRFNFPRRKKLQKLRSLGFNIAAVDEEATNISDRSYYQRNSVRKECLSLCEAAFCWGEYHAETVRDALPVTLQGIVSATGHPRFDILRAPYRSVYSSIVEHIRKLYGNFFLINSNSSRVVHDGNIEGLWHNFVSRGSITDTDINRERFFSYHQYRIQRHGDLVSLLTAIARAFPGHKVIIRPKFNETPQQWRAWLPAGLNNVHIIHDGSAVPWMMASTAMVHSGCTTGTEAFLAEVPAISYLRQFRPGFDAELPNGLSIRASSEGEVIDLLCQAVRGGLTVPKEERARQESLADRHIAARAGPLASERIAAHLRDIAFAHPDNRSRFKDILARAERVGVIDANGARHEEHGYRKGGRSRNSTGTSYEGIAQNLSTLFSLMPELGPVGLTQMQSKMLLLTPASETPLPKRPALWSRLRSALQRTRHVA